ncbi:hypothetical protein QYS48_28035 [Marivirga arenosa]|uniref:Uncharacterized protein n=1 Tax=Marivirga arenosa TaxID=3059076 RepID=A0AA51RCZ9_9BACT|nr:hypothetical protein [Marivirga sp. ABR2-2]WMN07174.1 hypothetical protein QYS48_28035 [Marivirga sp. ABR2-2]
MKRSFFFIFILLSPLIVKAQLNFGLTTGIKDYNAQNNLSGRYQSVDIRLNDNGVDYIQGGVFFELSSKKYSFLVLRLNLKTHNNNFTVTPLDYDPPGDGPSMIPNAKTYFSNYRSHLLDVIPSMVIDRKIQYRIGIGYQLNYMHHKNPEGLDRTGYDDRWWSQPSNQKTYYFANEIIQENPIKAFHHSILLNAEVRFWHLGLGIQYLRSLNSIAEPVNFDGAFIYPFDMQTQNFSIDLNFYWNRIKLFDY